MAREYIAITEDVAMSSFNINITAVHAADVDVEATQNLVASLRACRAQLDEALSEVTKTAAVTLTTRDIPVRDVGETLGVSHQRVSQLVAEARAGAEPRELRKVLWELSQSLEGYSVGLRQSS